jgi:L-iditol 2-dehydrogenase
MCRKYSYLGSRKDGGFSEYVAVPQENLIELPDNVTYEQAAMLEPMAVAIHSIRRVQVKEDDSVVVCGMGTIGLFVVMFLLEQGVKNLLVIGNKDFQKRKILELGVKEENYCDSKIQDVNDWLKTKSANYGFDVFFECVGKNETIKLAVDNAAPAGKVMLVGNPYGDITLDKSVYWKILRHQLIVTGTWNSSFTNNENDDWRYVINKLNERKIMPEKMITHKFSLDEIEKGYHIMRDKSEDYIKVMMVE